MIGAALLSLLIPGTLLGFCLAWPLAIAYRLASGRSPPSAPREGEPWSLGDIVWEGCYRLWTGRFLPWTPRRHVPWNLIDVAVIVLPVAALMLLPLLLADPGKKVANPPPIRPEQLQLLVLFDVGLKVFFVSLASAYLVVRAKATLLDFGLSLSELGRNVLVGIAAFVMIAPPVYMLQAAIVWFGKWQYEHPLIDMLQKSPSLGLFVVLALSACVVAPLTEEWFFRVVLQGWLERALAWLASWLDDSQPLVGQSETAGEVPPDGLERTSYVDLNPYALVPASLVDAPPATAPPIEAAREQPFPRSVLVHWLPIVISSVLFGLAHWGHGPAPITLTVFALGLGYVYQRTHSIVPVIVVHALFNSISMLLFYVMMFEAKQPLP